MNWIAVAAIGACVGFLAGMFGKGGSAIATPLLYAFGVPAFVAVAAPLPATIPSTLAASIPYMRRHMLDRHVVAWSIAIGIPATAFGALLSKWVSGRSLVLATDVLIAILGARLALRPGDPAPASTTSRSRRARLIAVAAFVGLASGLLANSGGFLLAPLYIVVLGMDVRHAFAASLVVAATLAVPGTIVHWALGHIDWAVVAVFGAASIPLSYTGALVAMRTPADRLERIYGVVLVGLGVGLFFVR